MKCQCEHAEHDKPCENLAEFRVKTPYGYYELCNHCVANRHMVTSFVVKRYNPLNVR
jgi:hypothetical protein